MSTINEARPVAERIEDRLEFGTMISELSSRFIDLHPGAVDREIEDALRRVCEPLGIDLAVLWQWSIVAPAVISPTHVYVARGGQRPTGPMREEQYPWARRQVLAGRVIAISSPEELPAEAAVDGETCRLFGIKSVLCVPLAAAGDTPVGALGFNALQVANIPAAITCTDVMAEKHPELVVAFLKGMIKVGRWANEHKRAAAAILDKQTFYRDVEATYEGIKPIDLVPNLSPQNLVSVEIGKDFMLSHDYIKNDFDVQKWAAPEFLEQAARELLEAQWKKVTKSKLPNAAAALASAGRIG